MPYRIVWNVTGGSAGEDEGTFQWADDVARLIEGPEEITGQHVQGKVEEYEIIDGEEVIIGYPAFSVNNMTIVSSCNNDWVNPDNPVKPAQPGGPILYNISTDTTPEAVPAGGYAQVGILDNYARFLGFARNYGSLDLLADFQPAAGDRSFWINIENGHMLARYPNITGEWRMVGQAKGTFPSTLQGEVDTQADLEDVSDDDVDPGDWYAAGGNVYMYQGAGRWQNIGPILGESQLQIGDDATTYISGYMYPLVFDRCQFRYVPRLSGGTQDTYEGEIDIRETGWFPQEPYDVDRNIYPLDSVTSAIPDDRELVTITYTVSLSTNLASGSTTVYQDVYQPTYNWENVINQLLDTTYFKNGIYH